METKQSSKIRWLPLESNPEVMNKYVESLGVHGPFKFCDVYGLDSELLAFLPHPVKAVLLLFPISSESATYREQEKKRLIADGKSVCPPEVYFMKQTVGNACGTVAIIHAVANNVTHMKVDGGLADFLKTTWSMSPDDKAVALEKDQLIAEAHGDSALEGQTEAVDQSVDSHFIVLVNVKGIIYELDGRKDFPINHGSTSEDTFLSDAANVVKEFMSRDPDNVNFNVIALAPPAV